MNENWIRWIKASFATHFQTTLEPRLKVYFEGNDHVNAQGEYVTTLPKWVEFRLDGPYWKELSHNYYQLKVEINILLSVRPANLQKDFYESERCQGIINAAFVRNLSMIRLGDGTDDDNQTFGCMSLITEGREPVVTSNFGLLAPDVELIQSTVEGHYYMCLKGSN